MQCEHYPRKNMQDPTVGSGIAAPLHLKDTSACNPYTFGVLGPHLS